MIIFWHAFTLQGDELRPNGDGFNTKTVHTHNGFGFYFSILCVFFPRCNFSLSFAVLKLHESQ